jgi:hypothetical protein
MILRRTPRNSQEKRYTSTITQQYYLKYNLFCVSQCRKQHPHRKIHPVGGHFEDEGNRNHHHTVWDSHRLSRLGRQVRSERSHVRSARFRRRGKDHIRLVRMSFISLVHSFICAFRKHFPYEDYDEWVFGPEGVWSATPETARPDVLVLQIGLHTCVHAFTEKAINETMIHQHEAQIPVLMDAVKAAVERPRTDGKQPTTVIVSTAGRQMTSDPRSDHCTWKLNRIVAHEAHKRGFPVFEREELEHRLLFKSEHAPPVNLNVKPDVHLDIPGPQIVATTLLNFISCLALNGSQVHVVGTGLQPKVKKVVVVPL